jgi:WD40 repeat protein/serine/threonine protein kinase
MDCLTDNMILELVEGTLTADQEQLILEHLDRCVGCRKLISNLALLTDGAGSTPGAAVEPASLEGEGPPADGAMVGHFRVQGILGRGGMGTVYLARDMLLGRRVALKVIDRKLLGSEAMVRQFFLEARATARFSHPNIVSIYAVGEHAGSPYLALEYIEGETLRRRIDARPLVPLEAARVGLAVAEALREAHEHQILHRDLKPTNVIVARDGRIRVLDFGLAELLDETRAPDPSRAPEGDGSNAARPRGTPFYMAPEVLRGARATQAADIWALGVLLHEAVSGENPFRSRSLTELRRRAEAAPALRGDVLGPLLPVVEGCLARDEAARPTARRLVESLQGILGGATLDSATRPDRAPFRGLAPFSEEDSTSYFGREDEVLGVVERLREQPLLAVVGPPGVGKSSFLMAGVVPRLREQRRWTVVHLRPGPRPLETLAARLAELGLPPASAAGDRQAGERARLRRLLSTRPRVLSLTLQGIAERRGTSVLLVVDQLEELYTLADPDQRVGMVTAIGACAEDPGEPLRVLVGVRDDFLHRFPETAAARALVTRIALLRPPDRPMLEEILTRPLERLGYRFEDPRLVDEILAGIGVEPTALPLLSFAGRLLWERRDRDRRLVTRAAFEEIGGVTGALARHADGVLEGLAPAARRTARQIFLRLVAPKGTRRVLSRARVVEGLGGAAGEVLDRLVTSRLIAVRSAPDDTDEPALELVHEALVRGWPRLGRWLDETSADRRFLADVGQAAELWERRGCLSEEVWRGSALANARQAADRCAEPVPGAVDRFLAAGQRRERRHARRRLLAVCAAFVALAGVTLVIAAKERETRRQRELAEQRRHQVESRHAEALREAAGAALRRGDLLEARAKLRLSLELEDSTPARVLWWRLAREPRRWRASLDEIVYDVAVSPDGTLVGAACGDRQVHLFELKTGAHRRALRGHRDWVYTLAFAPDGRRLATGAQDGEVRIWDPGAGTSLVLRAHTAAVHRVLYSRDGRRVLSASEDRTVRIWDPRDGRLIRTVRHPDTVNGLAVGPRDLVASGTTTGQVKVWDARTGRVHRQLDLRASGRVNGLAIDGGGRRLGVGSGDGAARLFNLATGRLIRKVQVAAAPITSVAFTPDGSRLAATSAAEKTFLVQTRPPWGKVALGGHEGWVRGLGIAADGRWLATGSYDRTVVLWSLPLVVPRRRAADTGHTSLVLAASFTPDGTRIATVGFDRTARLWDVASGEELEAFPHPGNLYCLAIDPKRPLLATGGTMDKVHLWDLEQRRLARVISTPAKEVSALAFAPDGGRLAAGDDHGRIHLFDLARDTRPLTLTGHAKRTIWSLQFSPDGRRLASCGDDGTVRVWELKTMRETARRRGGGELIGVRFTPDGRRLAIGGMDGVVSLWSPEGGASEVVGRFGRRVYWLDTSPDGRLLGIPLIDGTARLVSISKPRTSRTLTGHRNEVNYLRFSPDGRLAATTSNDGTLRLWDVARGRPAWRAPLLLSSPPRLLSHRGWTTPDLDGERRADAPRARWSRIAEARATLGAAAGALLCLHLDGGRLELWDRERDARLAARPVAAPQRLIALPHGCLVLAGGRALLVDPAGKEQTLAGGATAIASDGATAMVAARKQLLLFPPHPSATRPVASLAVPEGVTAIAAVGRRWLALGYNDGRLRIVGRADGRARPGFHTGPRRASGVGRLARGPGRTILAGFTSGAVGIFSARTGELLHLAHLHGALSQLSMEQGKVYAVTELGDQRVWDLSALGMPRCELMRAIWAQVPVIWERGSPRAAAAPPRHACSRR